MFVYFIECSADKPRVKIGKANDVARRLQELSTGCPFPLKVLGVITCKSERHAFHIEKSAHEVFRKERKRGEWFFLSAAMRGYIKAICERPGEEIKEAIWQSRYDRRERKMETRRAHKQIRQAPNNLDAEYKAIMGNSAC